MQSRGKQLAKCWVVEQINFVLTNLVLKTKKLKMKKPKPKNAKRKPKNCQTKK